MKRSAEYSIRGYVYQFNCYLKELLQSQDAEFVTIEGAIEDIDITSANYISAIQCKYHESANVFNLSKVYKPIIQMCVHFSGYADVDRPIRYRLYCHFPDEMGDRQIDEVELAAILSSSDASLLPLLSKIPKKFDKSGFIRNFTITFGPRLAELEEEVMALLVGADFSRPDVESVIYPFAFHRVASVSTRGRIDERTLEKKAFIGQLRTDKKAILNRWTYELKTRDKIFQVLKNNLRIHLSHNLRKRCFVLEGEAITDFQNDIVVFIKDYVRKYSFKPLHKHVPTFIFHGSNINLSDIQTRLYDYEIYCNDGYVGNEFRLDRFVKDPIERSISKGHVRREFQLRIARTEDVGSISSLSLDDVFLINMNSDVYSTVDMNRYDLQVEKLTELSYMLSIRNDYD